MKKLTLTLLGILGIFTLIGCSTTTNTATDPVAYNDSIVAIQSQAFDAYDLFDILAEKTKLGEDMWAVENQRIDSLETIKNLKKELLAMDGFEGDTTLRDAFANNLQVLVDSLENEEKEIVSLWIKRGTIEDEIPENEIELEKNLITAINDKDNEAYNNIVKAQDLFAAKHGYEIEEETTKEIPEEATEEITE